MQGASSSSSPATARCTARFTHRSFAPDRSHISQHQPPPEVCPTAAHPTDQDAQTPHSNAPKGLKHSSHLRPDAQAHSQADPGPHPHRTLRNPGSEYAPLVELVAKRMPGQPDPTRDVVFILRTGALFPMYRTFSLLEQLKGRVHVPTVLFYPGDLDGAAGLRFMGVLEAEHNYRPKIF